MAESINIANMVATVGFKVNKTEINSVKENIKSLKFGFLGMVSAIAAAGTAFFMFENHLGKMGTQLSNSSQILQIPVDKLQAMKVAAEQAGVPFATLTGALSSFQNAIVNMKADQGLPENMQRGLGDLSRITGVGLNPKSFKNGQDFFKAFAQTLKLVPTTQGKEGVLNLMFGNANLLPLLSGGMKDINKAYKELKAEGALLTPSDINKMHKFNMEVNNAKQQMSKLTAEIGIQLMPVLEKMFESMSKLSKNKDFINGLKDISKALAFLVQMTIKLISLIGKLGSIFGSDVVHKSKGGTANLGTLVGDAKGLHRWLRGNEIKNNADPNYGRVRAASLDTKVLDPIGNMFSAIGHHMVSAVSAAQRNSGSIRGGNSSVSNSTNNNTNNHTTNNTTVIHTHSNLGMMSSHVTGKFR